MSAKNNEKLNNLLEILNDVNLDYNWLPHILLSVSRSYRHIRAKLIHVGHKTKLSNEEAATIIYNTDALVKICLENQEWRLKFNDLLNLFLRYLNRRFYKESIH